MAQASASELQRKLTATIEAQHRVQAAAKAAAQPAPAPETPKAATK